MTLGAKQISVILLIVILILGLHAIFQNEEIANLKSEMESNQLDIAKPIWCNEMNVCYILKDWINLSNANASTPLQFTIIEHGLTIESVSISEVNIP